ncbi:MAG: ATP-binding protein [Candidatus Pseudobacter hemicellulosilyticus]|uniref:histidine kinase n=1 Tax=Candidatus Pseudobacter hemicellulosilyticus TaxID=3121375 RepID=A0AAJ6BEW8_9BACT|nr:MAG: ATP-binding protein [Pseudobacter sp.]
MNRLPLRLSWANSLLLVLCIVVLILILILNSTNNGISRNYRSSIDALSKEDTNLVILRNTYEDIVVAENHYRAYLASFDTTHRSLFENNMARVIINLELISQQHDSFASNLKTELAGKLKIAETISRLKGMADSLLVQARGGTGKLHSAQPMLLDRISSSLISKSFFHSVDTVKAVSVNQKQGFFSRLFGKKKDSTLVQYNKGQVDSTAEAEAKTEELQQQQQYDALALEVQRYYQGLVNRQMALRKKLDQNEKSLAAANLSIINEINAGIRELLHTAELGQKASKEEASEYLRGFQLHKDRILLFSFLIILLVAVLLGASIFRLNKYEQTILKAKSEAERQAQVKTRFLNNMSHEIRVPLTSIMGFTEQLEKKNADEEAASYINAIRNSSEHLLTTVNDILDFSKLEAGKFQLGKEPFSLKKTLEEVLFNLSVLAEKKQLSLQLKAGFDERLVLQGDAFRLKQILYNFISNAIKFTEKGVIEVKAETVAKSKTETEVVIAVKDSGIGIAADQLEFIFEEFAQVGSDKVSRKYHTRGTGLGLSICKMLAELQGGTVSVQSELKKGSVFTVKIPYTISQEAPQSQPVVKQPEQPRDPLRNKTVLLLEDNDVIVLLVTFLLKKFNMQYDVAMDGQQALGLLQQKQYDLLLTDINVPEISGSELTTMIRSNADPVKARMPIIALTADVTEGDLARYKEEGFTSVLKKPFREEDMVNALTVALSAAGTEKKQITTI